MRVCGLAGGGLALVAGVLALSAAVWGQTQEKTNPSAASQATTSSGQVDGQIAQDPSRSEDQPPHHASLKQDPAGPKKPTRKVEFVTTTDPVALLAVRRADILLAPALTRIDGSPSDGNALGDEKTEATELAETERLIKEKQKRILLLLRLFATDEQMFLRDPSAAEKDPRVQERRKYSQDELLWETAELARLKKRMNELEAAGRR